MEIVNCQKTWYPTTFHVKKPLLPNLNAREDGDLNRNKAHGARDSYSIFSLVV